MFQIPNILAEFTSQAVADNTARQRAEAIRREMHRVAKHKWRQRTKGLLRLRGSGYALAKHYAAELRQIRFEIYGKAKG